MRALYTFLTILLLLFPLPTQARISEIKKYDSIIEEATKRYWPEINIPELLKAQLYQESLLDPNAVSPVGAKGIAQFMHATWAEVAKALGFQKADILDPRRAIPAAAYYMAKIKGSRLLAGCTDPNLHKMAQASYNAGLGNISKARKLQNKSCDANLVLAGLGRVTGRHAKETQTYVRKIWQYYNELMNAPVSTDSHRRSLVIDELLGLRK